MLPVTLEGSGPLVKRADGFSVGSVQLLPAVAAHSNQANVAEDAQMFGDGGLLQAEGFHDVSNGSLGCGEKGEDLAPAGLSVPARPAATRRMSQRMAGTIAPSG